MLHYVRSTTLAPMITGGQVNAVPPPGETVSADGAPAAAWIETRSPQEICAAYGSDFVPPAPLDKVAVALNTLDQPPLNARRVSPERGACGWYVWGGEGGGRSRAAGFFQTLQVAHLLERCPQIIPFLALAPGWRVRLTEQGPDITPPHAAPPPDNVAVRRIGSRTTPPPMVKQWVWLSILLHILAVVLFGDTTGGGARRGDRVGGPLNVTLQGPVDRGAGERLALRADSRLSSLDARKDVLPAAPLARPAKDAPRNGMVSPTSSTATENGPVAPVMPPVIATEVEKPVTNFVVPKVTPEPVAVPEPPAARMPALLPRLETIVPPKVIDAPAVEREIALPTELIPRLAPLAPARTERETLVPPPVKTFVAPRIEPEAVAPPVELRRIAPMAPLAPPSVEREARPAELLPRLPPVAPAAAIETATPTDLVPRLPAATPAADDRASEPARATPPPAPSTTSTSANPAPAPLSSRAAPGVSGGAAETGDVLTPRGTTITPPPVQAAPGGRPRIDLDAIRQRAREIDREGAGGERTLLPFNVRPKQDIKSKEQQAFDKALKRSDCREAYASMGLAAVVPLLWDAVSEKGCKW